jgi:hypothetical protein
MMGWEAPLMEKHAAAICRGGGGHYLNVGFGLGIVDNEIQVKQWDDRLNQHGKLANALCMFDTFCLHTNGTPIPRSMHVS